MKPILLTIALLLSPPALAQTKKSLTLDEQIKLGKVIHLAAIYEAAAERCQGRLPSSSKPSKNKVSETINELKKHISAADYRELKKMEKSENIGKPKGMFFGGLSALGNTPSTCGYLLGLNQGFAVDGLDYYEQLTGRKF